MDSGESREPTLLRTWLLQTLLVAAAAGVLLYFVVGEIAQRQEVGVAGDLANRSSLHVFRELETRWLPQHPDSLVPSTPADFAELETLFELHRASLKIPRICWFDADHRIVHCGIPELRGVHPAGDDELLRAGEHERVERLIPAGEKLHLDGARFDVPLLEVYVAATPELDPRLRGHATLRQNCILIHEFFVRLCEDWNYQSCDI